MKELLINFAIDLNNNIVFAKDATKGMSYKCPECGAELVFKSSGKTGPGSRRPHFAHKGGGGSNCTPESLLHSAFKMKIAEILQEKINSGCEEVRINWKCCSCNKPYSGNLLFMVKNVTVEFDLGACRPDIALLNSTGKVIIAIEIVNTHSPEEETLKYYRDNGILLVQYNVTEDDLQDIEGKLHNPDHVSLCLDSNCNNYLYSNIYRQLIDHPFICRQCNFQGWYYVANCYTLLGHVWPDRIIQSDMDLLKSKGIELKDLRLIKDLYIGNIKTEVIATKCRCRPKLLLWSQPIKRSRRF